ncbi:MAG: TetR/AcrR family transcriptional regulator [Anaerolineales bacterium]
MPAEQRVDPRVKRTRKLLQQALIELMAEKSFRSITVRDIAARATLNRVTFYAHFPDKHALLENTIRGLIQERLRNQLPNGSTLSPDNLARLILTICEFVAEMDQHCPPPHGQMEPLMEKQIKTELFAILRGWLTSLPLEQAKHFASAEQAAMVSSWGIYGAVVQWNQQKRTIPAADFVEQVLPLILPSFQPTTG